MDVRKVAPMIMDKVLQKFLDAHEHYSDEALMMVPEIIMDGPAFLELRREFEKFKNKMSTER